MKIRNDDRIAYREGNFSELAEDVKAFLDAEAKPVVAQPVVAKKEEKKPEINIFEEEAKESK